MAANSFSTILNGDRYIITKNGVVFDTKNGIVKPVFIRNGYRSVRIRYKHYYIHRLLAQAFLPNPSGLKCINHIDGNKLNNSLDNLEWCSYSYNIQHAYDNCLRYNARKIKCVETGEEYGSISLAARSNGIKVASLSACLVGKHKTCNGLHWEYIN